MGPVTKTSFFSHVKEEAESEQAIPREKIVQDNGRVVLFFF